MKSRITLQSLEQLKTISIPPRMAIFGALGEKPMTTKQVALKLGEKITKLYHHVSALESAGLVELVETKQNRGVIEKYYRAIAKTIHVDRSLFAGSPQERIVAKKVQKMIALTFEETLEEVRQGIATKVISNAHRHTLIGRVHITATADQARELMVKLQRWLEQCRRFCSKKEKASYAATIIFYPLAQNKTEQIKGDRR